MGCMSRRSGYSKQRERFEFGILQGTQDVGYSCGCLLRGMVLSFLTILVNKLYGKVTSRIELEKGTHDRPHRSKTYQHRSSRT